MADDIKYSEVKDNYLEHDLHAKEYDEHCSECFKKASLCMDCDGLGELRTMESVYGGSDSHITAPIGSKVCDNCRGSGQELDVDIIKERLQNL